MTLQRGAAEDKVAQEDVDVDISNNAIGIQNSRQHRHSVPGRRGHVSSRGASNLAPPIPYLTDFFVCLGDPCDLKLNPKGHIPLCIAENKLMIDLLTKRLGSLETAKFAFDHPEVYGYNNALGLPVLREAVASFISKHFAKKSEQVTATTTAVVNPDQIAIGTGAINILSNILFALGNTGDGVLIPAPYYAAFDNDVRAFAGCIPVPVVCQDPINGPTPQDLESARDHAITALGVKQVKFLLITNPNNPLGVIYSTQVIQDCTTWARSLEIETIVDEIYALSILRRPVGDDTTKKELNSGRGSPVFESIVQITNNDLGTDIHWVWGLSKDFGASGFRVGVLYTQNEVLLDAMGNLHTFATVSHPMQRMIANMLSDDEFVEEFVEETSCRLTQSYNICVEALKQMEIPYVPANAGIFLYMDLSHLFGLFHKFSWQDEAQLCQLLMRHARIVFTPGHSQHDPKPGMFRICYAYVPPGILKVAMERLSRFVSIIRQHQQEVGDNDRSWVEDPSQWKNIL